MSSRNKRIKLKNKSINNCEKKTTPKNIQQKHEQNCEICYEKTTQIIQTTQTNNNNTNNKLQICVKCCQKLIQTPFSNRFLSFGDFHFLTEISEEEKQKILCEFDFSRKKFDENFRFCSSCKQFTNFEKINWSTEEQNKYLPIKCKKCENEYCFLCRNSHFLLNCFVNNKRRKSNLVEKIIASNINIKQCPRCSIQIERKSGCHHILCFCLFFLFLYYDHYY